MSQHQHLTKRDIYYHDPWLFTRQSTSDALIARVCRMLGCQRHDLFVVASAKGLAAGPIQYQITLPGQAAPLVHLHTSSSLTTISPHTASISSLNIGATRYVLVVEKDTVAQRIVQSGILARYGIALITGRGYPCHSTRYLLCSIAQSAPRVPMFCLVDADPHGMSIYWNYKYGSATQTDCGLLLPQLQFLGVSLTDLQSLQILECCQLPMTDRDRTRAERMMEQCAARGEEQHVRTALSTMLQLGVQAEIEALLTIHETYEITYIKHKMGLS